MKLLKKIGLIVLKATEIVTGFGPGLAAIIPGDKDDRIIQTASADLSQVAGIITQVEVFGAALGIAGPDKLRAAAPAVAQVILRSTVLAGRKIHDTVLFQAGCTQVAAGMADILNSLKDDVPTIDMKD